MNEKNDDINYDNESSMSKKDRLQQSMNKQKEPESKKKDRKKEKDAEKEKENIQMSRTSVRVSIKYTGKDGDEFDKFE